MPLLALLKHWQKGLIGVLVLALIYTTAMWRIADSRTKQARIIYENPKKTTQVRTVYKEGPTRIVTKYIERASGDKETLTIDEGGGDLEYILNTDIVEPVAVADLLKEPRRTDRWLLGAQLLNYSPREIENWRGLAGYSFRNRLDVLAGYGYDRGHESSIALVIRF